MPAPLTPLELSLRASDGLVLKGVLEYPDSALGSRYPLAVLAHQYPATSDSYGPLLDDLLDLGVAVLAFDQRGHGASIQGPDGAVVIDTPLDFSLEAFGAAFMGSASRVQFQRIEDDILRVAAWGASQNFIDVQRIVLVGASVGGSGVLLAAPRVPALRALVTLGAAGAPVFGEDAPARIRKALEELQAPAWLASSQGDPFAGADNVRTWARGLKHVTTKIVPGDAHAMAIYYDVRDELLAFLERALGL